MVVRLFFVWNILFLLTGYGSCSQCPSTDNESLLLEKGRSYTYRFHSEALSEAVGTTDDRGRLALSCDVRLFYDQPCTYHLHLEGCRVTAEGGRPGVQAAWIDGEPVPGLSTYPVSFSLENGQIHAVKSHVDDPLHFVNIKRGVLSAFVFKMAQTKGEIRESHTDVHGTCPMHSRPGADPSTVMTSKDMLRCHLSSRYDYDWQLSPWSLFWNMSFIQHVINSTTECTYGVDVDRRRVDEVRCKERHAFMLMSTHKTTIAVQTNINYQLTFVSEEQTSNPWSGHVPLVRKSGIQIEYEDTSQPLSSPPRFLDQARKMLSDLVLESVSEVRLSTIPRFTDLVAWFRFAHDLVPLVDSVRECAFLPQGIPCDQKTKDLSISFLSDALLQCNSLPCFKALTHLATHGGLSTAYLDLLYLTWSYMHHAEHSFISSFGALCNRTQSHQCWLSLGSYVRRTHTRAKDLGQLTYELRKEAIEISKFFRVRIHEFCDSSEDEDSKTLPDCLIFLKAAGNTGPFFGLMYEVLDVATNEDAPTVVRASALETLKDVTDISCRFERNKTYDQLLPLLKNESLPASLRILAYDQLIDVSKDHYFEEHLLGLLKDGKNAEVKHYVASNLEALMTDKEFRTKRRKFFPTLYDLLRENDLSLDVILYDSKGRSRSQSRSALLNLDFLPDSMRRFGLKMRDSFLYPVYPSVVSHETVLQLFSALLPTTKLHGYFEGFEQLLQDYQKNLREMDSKTASASKMFEALLRTLEEYGKDILQEGSLRDTFDNEDVLSNLKKLHRLYWQHHTKVNPIARIYFDLFGSTISYFTLDNLPSGSANQLLATVVQSVAQKLSQGLEYSGTRVIRLIEAYHQVPTMMGMPLNWTTHATLAFSVGARLQYDATGKSSPVRASGFLEPSAALTFLNRMVLDFPTLTQIGVQANSSAHTSTQLRASFDHSEGRQSLRFERPRKTQKVLELFRTNQMIKHDRYEDIEDWDVERVSSSWCSGEDVGLKFCLSKSYPNVTHRLKPWAPMAGRCKLQYHVHPTNQDPAHYDFELLQQSAEEGVQKNQYDAKVSFTEGEVERATRFRAITDESGRTQTMELKTSLSPDFGFFLSRSDLTTGKEVTGHKLEATLQLLKDFAYRLEVSSEDKVLKSASDSGSPPDEDSLKHEGKVSLTTPYGTYLWNKTSKKLGESVKIEASAVYENLGGESTWLKSTLPPSFWEDEKRASAKIRLHWKKPVYGDEGNNVTRHTEFLMQIPRYVMTLNAKVQESRRLAFPRQQSVYSLARTDLRLGKLDAFMNLTVDWWSNEDRSQHRKDMGTVNLTISRRSWEASFQRIGEDKRFRHDIKLRRALMRPKIDAKSDYVGWWSEAVSDRFSLEEQEVRLTADNSLARSSAQDLVDKYPTVTAEDVEGEKGRVHDISNYLAITYPYGGRTESVVYQGCLISFYTVDRYQMNFDLTSSYHDLKLTSRSVLDSLSRFTQSSFLTHQGTGTRASSEIRYSSERLPGWCRPSNFHHEIRSHVLDLTTHADWTCREEEKGRPLYRLRLDLDTNSSMWNALDVKIEQVIEDVSSEKSRGEMTLTHAAGTIHVDAQGTRNLEQYEMRVTLCSKEGNCPNAELSIDEASDTGLKTIKLALPNDQITYERKISSNSKHLDVRVDHYNNQGGSSDVLDFTGEILNRRFHVWRGAVNGSGYAKVSDLISYGYTVAAQTVARDAADEGHPLNKILRPTLKMTLRDYWAVLKKQVRELSAASWGELLKVVYAAESITEPVHAIFVDSAERWCREAYKYLEERTFTVWAIDYFHVANYFKEGLTKIPLAFRNLVHQLSMGEKDVFYFKHVTGNSLWLESFKELPPIDNFPLLRKIPYMKLLFWLFHPEGEGPDYARWIHRERAAAIFGARRVYTFDGHLYEGPSYAEGDGCSYLLAHDVHSSLFTLLSTRDSVHLLFPEMSLTIDDEDRVFVNGSRNPSPLPLQSHNGKVTVRRSHVVEVWSPSLSVVCRGVDFLCVFKLSEYHSGGTVGLLGNADDQPTNDFTLPDGSVSSDPTDFVRAYEVSGRPSCGSGVVSADSAATPTTKQAKHSCDWRLGGLCADRSDLRKQFVEACESDVTAGQPACHASSALAALCHLQYSPTFTYCGTCEIGSPAIGLHLAVVLVVQQSKWLSQKGLESLIWALDDRFNYSGYQDVRFSLVGFGGKGVHAPPSVYAVGKDIWLSADDAVDVALKRLEFDSGEEADEIQALRYAVEELALDTFGSKVIVAVTARDRPVSEEALRDYFDYKLRANGVTLYSISSYPSLERNDSVFGVRADRLLVPGLVREDEAYLDFSRGGLARLASISRGAVFHSRFLRGPPLFFDELAQEVWSKVAPESQWCRECEREKGRWWWLRTRCHRIIDADHCAFQIYVWQEDRPGLEGRGIKDGCRTHIRS